MFCFPMKRFFLMFLTLVSLAALARADDQTDAVQQALKDQGFYYGTVDGQGGTETDAAIRRYQIRQGLEVTGKLNAQTLASLNLGGGAKSDDNSPQAAPPPGDTADSQPSQAAPESTPPRKVVESDRDFLKVQPEATPVPPAADDEGVPRAEAVVPQPYRPPPPAAGAVPPPPDAEGQTTPKQYSWFLRKTPYETAPPVVQRDTVQRAQERLGRQGFYRGVADGELSDRLARSLSAYQKDAGLHITGRLDMDTLDDMNLLPRRHVVMPPPPPPPYGDAGPPVYRGIWVH